MSEDLRRDLNELTKCHNDIAKLARATQLYICLMASVMNDIKPGILETIEETAKKMSTNPIASELLALLNMTKKLDGFDINSGDEIRKFYESMN